MGALFENANTFCFEVFRRMRKQGFTVPYLSLSASENSITINHIIISTMFNYCISHINGYVRNALAARAYGKQLSVLQQTKE